MYILDSRLRALANCAVIPITMTEKEKKKNKGLMGGITFGPYPTIVAGNDLVLSHEICHRLAGKRDYDIFNTAVQAEDCPIFKFTLNILYDWFHEWKYESYSPFLKQQVLRLHEAASTIKVAKSVRDCKELMHLIDIYETRSETPDTCGIEDCHTLVYLAKSITNEIKKNMSSVKFKKLVACLGDIQVQLNTKGITGAGGSNYTIPEWSNYYTQAVARYGNIINILKDLWIRNKYDWQHKHYGEIDWKNLVKVYMGEKLGWSVFLILAKILLFKNIYLVVDRSGSTSEIKNEIMDTAVIITESLRQCDTPISIIDVGVEDKIVNKIDEPLSTSWFTPMSYGGTPIGEVCSTIEERNPDSLLIMITDGLPNSFTKLADAIQRFPGNHVTFVIGEEYYQEYATLIDNTLCVEPYTIIKELMYFIKKGGRL